MEEDLGPPIAWLALEPGTPAYDPDGERVGVVEHMLGDEQLDIFDGLVIHAGPLPGHHRFADVEQIASLHERGVKLAVGRDELHDPSDAGSRGEGDSPLEERLRRAWERISGR